MTFGEKIYKFRKEKGLSQEELADQLNVSRQSISKWETDNGYPETEKIIKMAKIFNVTIDYLLNNENDKSKIEKIDNGIYVSEEKITGFLSYEKRKSFKIALSFGILISSLAFCYLDSDVGILLFMILFITSICLFVSVLFIDNPYKDVYKQKIFIDKNVRKKIIVSNKVQRNKNHFYIIAGVLLICIGFLFIPLMPYKSENLENLLLESGMLIAGVGTFLVIYLFRNKKIDSYILNSEEC